jgi:hypothetical protein
MEELRSLTIRLPIKEGLLEDEALAETAIIFSISLLKE